jgi:glycosyltransferase involved in cell wall biosynthesis
VPAPDVTLITPYPPGGTGVAAYSAALTRALAERGARVAVVAPETPGEPAVTRDGAIEVRRCFRRGAGGLLAAARAARGTGAGVVHVQHEVFLYGGPASLPALPPALGALRRRGGRCVVTMHHVVEPGSVDTGFTQLHRVRAPAGAARLGLASVQGAIRRLADAIVVHEPAFARVVPEAVVVPHGVGAEVTPDREGARAALGLDDRLTVLCFGYLAPYKGLERVLEAAALVRDDVHVVVAGGEHPRLAEAGDDYAARLRHRHGAHATFTGHVPDGDVDTWFAAADAALFPYPRPFATSGPLALALGHATPVLLSPPLAACIGAPADAVVPLGAEAMAASLRAFAADRSRLDAARVAGRELAAGRAWPAVADRHLELYREVIHAPRAARRRLRAG